MKLNQQNQPFRPKRNYSSFGQSKAQVQEESTDSTYNEQSLSPVEEVSRSHSAPSTPSSKECAKKGMSSPAKATQSEVEPSGSITPSPKQASLSSNTPTIFLQGCVNGLRSEPEVGEVLKRTLDTSPLIRSVTFPLIYPLLGIDDRAKFSEMLIHRENLRCEHRYPRLHLYLYDAVMLADLVRCYISDVLGIDISINLKR